MFSGEKVSMTVPVVTEMKPKSSENFEMTKNFYLPSQNQDNSPSPIEENVNTSSTPQMLVYVR